jgi:hypothetical protein
MCRRFGLALVTAGLAVSANGQSLLDEVNFRSAEIGGVHLYGVSVFGGYSTTAYPLAGSGIPSGSFGAGTLGPDETYGASASVGWQRHRGRSNFSAFYSASYGGMVRYSDLNGLSQSFSVAINRELSRKWSVSLSGSGQDSRLAQYVYQPSGLSVVAQAAPTFDDLAALASIGQFSSPQTAAMLTGTSGLASPLRTLLLGDRVLSYSTRVSARYAHSSRLSFSFGGFAAGGQHISDSQQNGSGVPNYSMPHSIGMDAGMSMNYQLSPRTTLGMSLDAARTQNPYQSAYTNTANASVGRKMGPHWFLRAYGGGSYSILTQQLYNSPGVRQVVGGGSLGFRTYEHTFMSSYDRSSVDNYGFGVGTNTNLTGSWSWNRPGRSWTLSLNFGQQKMNNTGFASFSGWQGSAAWSRRLNAQTSVTAQYVYLSSTGQFLNSFVGSTSQSLSVHSVRLSLSWAPQSAGRSR